MDTSPASYVTFLHGLGGSPLSWEEQVSKLPGELPARAPWLRGLRPGTSGQRESFTLADAAADVLWNLTLEGIDRAAIVGHSLGAMVALQCALDAPQSVSHLVLIAGQVRPSPGVMRAQKWALRFVPAGRLARQGVDKQLLTEALDDAGRFDARGELREIACPTLVVCGSRDRPNMPASRLLATQIPDARLEVIEGAGHDVMRDRPAQLNDLLYAFLGYPAH